MMLKRKYLKYLIVVARYHDDGTCPSAQDIEYSIQKFNIKRPTNMPEVTQKNYSSLSVYSSLVHTTQNLFTGIDGITFNVQV